MRAGPTERPENTKAGHLLARADFGWMWDYLRIASGRRWGLSAPDSCRGETASEFSNTLLRRRRRPGDRFCRAVVPMPRKKTLLRQMATYLRRTNHAGRNAVV